MITMLFTLFVILQVADGFFTFHGVNIIGIDIYEASPLSAWGMHKFGIVQTILFAKLFCILLGYFLYKLCVLKNTRFLWLLSIVTIFYSANFTLQIYVYRILTANF